MLTKTLEFKQPWRVQPQRKANQIIFSYLEEWKIHYQNDKNFTSWKIFNTESMMIIKICSINFQVWFESINHLIQQWDRMWIIVKVDASTKIHNKIHNSGTNIEIVNLFSDWKYLESKYSSVWLYVNVLTTNGTVFASASHCMILSENLGLLI